MPRLERYPASVAKDTDSVEELPVKSLSAFSRVGSKEVANPGVENSLPKDICEEQLSF